MDSASVFLLADIRNRVKLTKTVKTFENFGGIINVFVEKAPVFASNIPFRLAKFIRVA